MAAHAAVEALAYVPGQTPGKRRPFSVSSPKGTASWGLHRCVCGDNKCLPTQNNYHAVPNNARGQTWLAVFFEGEELTHAVAELTKGKKFRVSREHFRPKDISSAGTGGKKNRVRLAPGARPHLRRVNSPTGSVKRANAKQRANAKEARDRDGRAARAARHTPAVRAMARDIQHNDDLLCDFIAASNVTKEQLEETRAQLRQTLREKHALEEELHVTRETDLQRRRAEDEPFTWAWMEAGGRERVQAFTPFMSFDALKAHFALLNWNNAALDLKYVDSEGVSRARHATAKLKSARDNYILFFVVLCTGMTASRIAQVKGGGFRRQAVSNIFITWLLFLYEDFKATMPHADKDVVLSCVPQKTANRYRNNKVYWILDALEIFLETPSSLALKAAFWSDYKHTETAKALIAIYACGAVVPLTDEAWPGRISDPECVRVSRILEHLESGTTVAADKGFTIAQQCAQHARNIGLAHPPFKLRGMDFSEDDCDETSRHANARIHVERAVKRLREFGFLDPPYSLRNLDILGRVLFVCTCLCNYGSPLTFAGNQRTVGEGVVTQ